MPKTLNVLSIDYDFFQIVSLDTLQMCYPDGHDFATALASFIWMGHYASPSDRNKIMEIRTNREKVDEIIEIIKRNAILFSPKAMIANSHVHIYDFILNEFKEQRYKKLNLVNIDMHHDMFNRNTELDCGNWVSYIVKEISNVSMTWIANPVSREAYGLISPEFDIIENNFNMVKKTHWDLIYLCRSDIWTPPHLDNDFIDIANAIMDTSKTCQYEPIVLKSRYDDPEFHKSVKSLRSFYEK